MVLSAPPVDSAGEVAAVPVAVLLEPELVVEAVSEVLAELEDAVELLVVPFEVEVALVPLVATTKFAPVMIVLFAK